MVRSNPVKIVFILVFFLGVCVFTQEKQVNDEKDKKLREEILSVYQSKGEQELRDFIKRKKDNITNKFILAFAGSGVDERKEEWLRICEILSEERNEEMVLIDVYYLMGEYFYLVDENERALEYFNKSFRVSVKANIPIGQGNALHGKGKIFALSGEYNKALEMYNQALKLFEVSNNPILQGNVYLSLGDIYNWKGEFSMALRMYKKSLSFYEKTSRFIGKGYLYQRMGAIYSIKGNNAKAVEMWDIALSLFEKGGELLGQGQVFIQKGKFFFNTGKNEKALAMYDRAMDSFKKAKSLQGQGEIYIRKGEIYLYTGQHQKALEMSDNALELLERAGNPVGQGNIYLLKGKIYCNIGDYKKANEMGDKALKFYKKMKQPLGQGQVYELKGDIYLYQGDYLKAQQMYKQGLPFFKQIDALIDQGNIYKRKGDAYFYSGNFKKAFKMYNEALSLYKKSGNSRGQGNIYRDKGEIYWIIGDNYKAMKMLDNAMLFFNKENDPIGKGYVCKRKGDILAVLGKTGNAIKMINNAISFFIKTNDYLGMGNALRSKGEIYSMNSQHSKAIEMYRHALTHYKKVEDQQGEGNVYFSMGNNYSSTGNYSKSLEMYEMALVIYEKIKDIVSAPSAFHGKAKVLAKLGKTTEALDSFEKEIEILEKVRYQAAFSDMKKTFMESTYNQHEETVFFMLENKYYDKGFKYAETMKARVFLDKMGEGLVPLEKGLKPELRKKRDILVAKLSNINKEMHKTAVKEEKKLNELKEQYRKVENEFEDLLIKIRLDNPLYASVRYPQPISVQALQKDVLKKGEILVRYFITSDKAYVFLVSKNRFKVVPLEVKAERIKSYANRLLLAMRESRQGDMEMYGKLLYRELFKPIESKLKGSRDIIIIPDSHLEKIPFESFIMGEEKSDRPLYLLEKYRIKYIQSASLLSVLRKHYQRNRETDNFIGFGDPVYDYENFKQGQPEQGSIKTFATESTEVTESIFNREDTRSDTKEKKLSSVPSVSSVAIEDEIKEIFRSRYARVGGLMNRLQGSGEEVRTIARLFENKSQKSLIHLREQATEDNAKAANLKEFDYIHFACHGILEDEFQCLALSQLPKAQSSEDGYFTLNEIMNCDYNAKLVVLSACKTGTGKMERAEGVTGLTRAVMYAGTPAVVASLWHVDDPAAKELMVTFYRNMLEKNLDKVEALRQAKLDMIKEKKYASPLFWGAFIMYGE